MNCREFLIEFEDRGSLSEPATFHLTICADCKKISGEQIVVWQMIDGLNQVAVPNDFDFRVKARIAQAKPSDFQPRFLPALRYVLSGGIVVLLVGFIAFNTLFSSSPSTEQAAKDASLIPAVAENPSVNTFSANSVAAINNPAAVDENSDKNIYSVDNQQAKAKKETEFTAVKSPIVPRINSSKTSVKDISGSKTSTFKSAPVIIPENFSANKITDITPNLENTSSISVEQIGKFIGIEIISEDGKYKVKNVTQNSSAERSGIKVGDIIEELNGKKLSGEPLKFKTIEAKTITVSRASEKLEINLQN